MMSVWVAFCTALRSYNRYRFEETVKYILESKQFYSFRVFSVDFKLLLLSCLPRTLLPPCPP